MKPLSAALFSSASFLEAVDNSPQEEQLEIWRTALDALSAGKLSWEHLLQGMSLSTHPARLLTTRETGNSLLHLAVLSNRLDLVKTIIAHLPQLKLCRNSLRWSPLELARFLSRKEICQALEFSAPAPFTQQPNVLVEDSVQSELLHSLEYLPQPVFESKEVFEEILNRSNKAKMEDAIPPETIWMGIYFDKEIQEGIHPKVAIRFIDERIGFGVFAEQRIPSCSFVGEYRGVIQEKKKKELKKKVHCVRYPTWETGRRHFILDAEKMGNFTRFINHSSKPNLSLQSVYWRGIPRMILVSLKELSKGTQLTFDYGSLFWKECHQTPILVE